MKTLKEFGIVMIFCILSCTLIYYALQNTEIKECKNWQAQAEIYPGFYLLDWQKAQCEAHGIDIELNTRKPKITTAVVFAYNSEVCQTDDKPFEMASGNQVYDGAIACPTRLKFGTRIEYKGITYTCEDRMAERYREGNYFDIWMESREEAIEFGRQEGLITIY